MVYLLAHCTHADCEERFISVVVRIQGISDRTLTNAVALTFAVPRKACGGAKRRSPTGGFANGIPRYSDTSGREKAGWPRMVPLVVRTAFPTEEDCPGPWVLGPNRGGPSYGPWKGP